MAQLFQLVQCNRIYDMMKKLLTISAFLTTMLIAGKMNAQIASADTKAVKEQTAPERFQEIKIDELPVAVTESVKENFERANIGKAYINNKNQYKLVLEMDGMEKIVYANTKGERIKPTKLPIITSGKSGN